MATVDRKNLRVVFTLEGEAMNRLILWAQINHVKPTTAAKKFFIDGMKSQGLLLKNYIDGD